MANDLNKDRTPESEEELESRCGDFYRAVAVENLLEQTPRDYGTGVMSNMTEAHMMIDICDHDGITVGELATMSARTASAVSQIVSRLERKGYLIKSRNKDNYRSYNIYPTEKGTALAKAHKDFDLEETRKLHSYLLEHCSKEELDTFYKVLNLRTGHVLEYVRRIKQERRDAAKNERKERS